LKFRLIISERADEDWSAILETLARGGGDAALTKYMNRLDRLYEVLAERPDICANRPRLGKYVRAAVVHPYLVIYQHVPGDAAVEVIRIVHGRRKITRRALR
jgi:toxin ParE1/3/4